VLLEGENKWARKGLVKDERIALDKLNRFFICNRLRFKPVYLRGQNEV